MAWILMTPGHFDWDNREICDFFIPHVKITCSSGLGDYGGGRHCPHTCIYINNFKVSDPTSISVPHPEFFSKELMACSKENLNNVISYTRCLSCFYNHIFMTDPVKKRLEMFNTDFRLLDF